MKQKHSSDSHPLPCSYLSADNMLRLPWCIWCCCSLVASPYRMWLKQPLSFNTSNFLQAQWCWKKRTLNFFGVLKNTTVPPDWHLSPNFTGFGLEELSEHTPGGKHAQLCPCSSRLWASFTPFLNCILIIEIICMPKSHISSLAHTSLFLKASFLPQHLTLKQFTCVTPEKFWFSVWQLLASLQTLGVSGCRGAQPI